MCHKKGEFVLWSKRGSYLLILLLFSCYLLRLGDMSRVKLFNEIYKNHKILQKCFENCEDNENNEIFYYWKDCNVFYLALSKSISHSVSQSQSVSQSFSKSVSQSVNHLVSQSQSVSQSFSKSVSQSVGQSFSQSESVSQSFSQSESVSQSIIQPVSQSVSRSII